MDSLDELVTQAQGLSGRRDDLAHLQGLLQSKGADLLSRASRADLERVLAVLDPAAHSLAWLWVLDALTSSLLRSVPPSAVSLPGSVALGVSSAAALEQAASSIAAFLALCSGAQVRMDPARFAGLGRRLKESLLALGVAQQGMRGLLPLRSALEKLQPSPEHLTPLHVDLLQLCLLTRCYSFGHQLLCAPAPGGGPSGSAGPAVEQLLCEVDPHETGITQTDFLLFCYYGGMVCIGMRRLEQAFRLLLQAVTAPAAGLSAIAVASYKKLVLLSLLLHGKMLPMPRFTPSVVQRQLKPFSQEYSEIAEAYPGRDPQALQSLIAKHKDVLERDSNLGLAKQVLASLHTRSIQRLTQTFLTLSLHDIAQSTRLPSEKDAQRHILRMIEAGEIHASISQKDGMVSFTEDSEHYNTHRMAQHLNAQITRTMELARKLEDMETSIACDRLYLHRMHMREKTGRFVDSDEIEFGGPSRMFDTM